MSVVIESPRVHSCFSRRRLLERNLAAEEASRQAVRIYQMGGESDDSDTLLPGIASSVRRSPNLAKRRKVIVKEILEAPQNFPITEQNRNIIVRQFERIVRFAKTLRNKRRLNPAMAEILDMDVRTSSKAAILKQVN